MARSVAPGKGSRIPALDLEAGTLLGPYEIVSLLGKGGMGEVHRARDSRLERDVAIKVLRAEWSGDASCRERLEREAKRISRRRTESTSV
jgi:serine/threonine protein kinase